MYDLPPEAGLKVAELLLDGDIEIEINGAYLSGPAAGQALLAPDRARREAARIGQLSSSALRLAATLPTDDLDVLTANLYFFNRAPASLAWRRRLRDADATARFLRIAEVSAKPGFQAHWRPANQQLEWFMWRRRNGGARGPHRRRYKLYLSPTASGLPEVIATAPPILAEMGADAFKVGASAHGVLRPDCFVAYFSSLTRLLKAAAALATALGDLSVRGVPFTVSAGGDGLLSWGLDPRPNSPARRDGESWRLWICRHLARSVLTARRAGVDDGEIAEVALGRLWLSGARPGTFRPDADYDHFADKLGDLRVG